jgi:hypothetical protein
MRPHGAMKIFARYFLFFLFLIFAASSGCASELTQRDWMIALVDATGGSYGLPDEPQDPDYINILTGNREFRFEAEDVFTEGEDNVSIMSFQNFGTSSGWGWLHGTKAPTQVHLSFTLPLAGEYEIKAQLRQKGHLFNIAGEEKTADAKDAFTEVSIGNFSLQSGAHEIVVTLPVNGSIDDIILGLPPGGGVDVLTLTGRQIDVTLASTLLDFRHKEKPAPRDLDSLSTLLAAFGIER